MLEWHGREKAVVQSWLGEELRVSFADQQLHIRHGNDWYTDISFTAQTNGADERRISFQQTGTYHGERHTIDFSYVLNGNGTVSGYATSSSLGMITANGTCFITHDGVS